MPRTADGIRRELDKLGHHAEMSDREFVEVFILDLNTLRIWLEQTGMTPAQAVAVYTPEAVPLRVCRPEFHPEDGRPVLRLLLPPRVRNSMDAAKFVDNHGQVVGGAGEPYIPWE